MKVKDSRADSAPLTDTDPHQGLPHCTVWSRIPLSQGLARLQQERETPTALTLIDKLYNTHDWIWPSSRIDHEFGFEDNEQNVTQSHERDLPSLPLTNWLGRSSQLWNQFSEGLLSENGFVAVGSEHGSWMVKSVCCERERLQTTNDG